MNKLNKITLFILAAAFLVTCKKEQIPQSAVIGQPVFSFAGTINSKSVNWQAGVNNYYMYSYYSQDTNNLYSFTGNLQTTSSPNNSISITINDYEPSAKNASVAAHIDSSFTQPLYSYNTGVVINDTTGYSVKFTPLILEGTPISYYYKFGDGGTSSAPSPTHTYKTAKTYTTSLAVTFVTCGTMTITNPVNIVKQANPLTINSITDSIISNSGITKKIKISASVLGGTPPYTYSWVLGDGHTSTLAAFTDTYIDSLHKHTYSCALTVTDNAPNTVSYNAIIADTVDGSICLFDYFMSSPKPVIVVTNSNALSDVTILYTNGSGVQYTSNNALQPNSSTFQINSVSNYNNNSNNQATKMLNITFNCYVYNPGVLLPINITGTAIIAVAYH